MDSRADQGEYRQLGRLLRDARRRSGLTQHELAGRAGLSLGAVRDLEQGRSRYPRAGSLQALAAVLGLGRRDRAELQRLALRRRPAPPVPAGPVRVLLLGPLAAQAGGAPVPIGSGRHRVVLARLALSPNRPVSRDELVTVLWPEQAPPSASNVVQTHISRLRRILEPAALVLTPGGYQLRADEGRLDLLAYRARLEQSRLAAGSDPARAFELLTEALELWRGYPPAEDVPELAGHPLVTGLSDELVEATIRLAHLGEALHRLPEVLPRLRRLAVRHPWHESLHARLVVALAASGQQAAALEAFDGVRRRLADELGIDPGAELAAARQAVLERSWAAPASAGRPPVPWQAPAPPPDFTGRGRHLSVLRQRLRSASAGAGTGGGRVAVCVISGMAGVGKTSLALRAAQLVRAEFPDGQLYIDLRGADRDPLGAMDALARLLRGLGVAARAIPADPDEAGALYRSVLADRRVLLILDNARNAAQVRPLLPGTGGGAALVTSRNQCAELEGATLVGLPVLGAGEALDMLGRRVGHDRVSADRSAARALVEACGRLPVALRVLASRLAVRPEWTFRDLLARLAETRSGLDQFSVGDLAVTASFDLSYRELEPRAAAVFRSASLVPGKSFSATAVAALLPPGSGPVGPALESLVDENLLQPVGAGRYRYHDLLRLYAVHRMDVETSGPQRAAALNRLLEWYLARTAAAMRLVYAEMVRLPAAGARTDGSDFDGRDAAMAWLDGEIGTLVELVRAAGRAGSAAAWRRADQLRGYFFERRDAVPWLATGRAGLSAAEAAGDVPAQAAMHLTVGQAHWSVGKHRQALAHYERGVAAARAGGWLVGEAYLLHNLGLVNAELGQTDEAHELYLAALRVGEGAPGFAHTRAVTLNDLGALCTEQGRLRDAARHLAAALSINQGAARRPSAMANRGNLGMVLRQLEDFDAARHHLEIALTYYRETGSANGQMSILDELSQLHRQRGEHRPAVATATEALNLAELLRNAKAEAGVLNTLGFALLGTGSVDEARARFKRSLRLSRDGGYRYFQAQSRVGIAEAELAAGALALAESAAEEALEIARSKGYQVLEGDAFLALARAALGGGDVARAAECCVLARRAYKSSAQPEGVLRRVDEVAASIGQPQPATSR